MRKLVLLGAFVAGLAASVPHLRADDAPPPDVQAVIDKLQRGEPPTEDERKKLQAYGQEHMLQPVNGVTWGDIIAIMNTMTTTKNRPTDADIAKMKKWAEGMKGKEAELRKDLERFKKNVKPGKESGKKHKLDEGLARLSVKLNTTARRTEPEGSLDAHTEFHASYPVTWMVDDREGELHIRLLPFPGADRVVKGTYSLNGSGNSPSRSETQSSSFAFTSKMEEGGMAMMELVAKKGLPRAFVNIQASAGYNAKGSLHKHWVDEEGTHDKDGETVAACPATLSLDQIHEQSPFLPAQSEYRQMALAQVPADMKAAIAGAKCTFDVEGFRKSWAKGDPFKLKLAYTYHIATDKDHEHSDSYCDWTLDLEFGDRESELVIGPESKEKYEKWIPRPYNKAAPDADYEVDPIVQKAFGIDASEDLTVSFVVAFKPKAGGTAPRGKLEIQLKDVSENKGVCINYPRHAVTKKGLFFVPDQEGLEITNHGQTAKTKEEVTSIKVKVAAREPGAFGALVGTCPALGETATWEPSGLDLVPIPDDEDKNSIADQWQRDKGIWGKSRPMTWNDDAEPQNSHPGDQFQLYDEYRGVFVEDDKGELKHVRLEPTKKEAFVWVDDDNAPGFTPKTEFDWPSVVRQGAALYDQVTGFKTYVLTNRERVEVREKKSPRVNFNSNLEEACAVRVTRDINECTDVRNGTKGKTPSWSANNSQNASDPSDARGVFINLADIDGGIAHLETWNRKNLESAKDENGNLKYADLLAKIEKAGFNIEKVIAAWAARRGAMVREYTIYTIAHELLHSSSVNHHDPLSSGDRTCLMYYWDSDHNDFFVAFAFMEGRYKPDRQAYFPPEGEVEEKTDVRPWTVCEQNRAELNLKPKKK